MTTYSICNQKTGADLGRYVAKNAFDAITAAGGGEDLIATAVADPAPAACPFKLPLTVGTPSGSVPDQIFDANGQAVLILYGVDQRGPLETAREMKWNQEGLRRGDYVVKAVNEHEGLVQRVAQQHKDLALMAEHNREFVLENRKLVERVAELERDQRETLDDIKSLEAHVAKISAAGKEIQQLTAKPVDRRKD